MPEPAIFTNLCHITDGAGNILMQHRHDPNWPGWCCPGGHVEPDESFVRSVIREVWEETGLTIENPTLCGIKQFRSVTGARYVVLFFRADRYHGTLRGSDEGEVRWLPRAALADYPLCDGMLTMLEVMESDSLSEMQYIREDGELCIHLY